MLDSPADRSCLEDEKELKAASVDLIENEEGLKERDEMSANVSSFGTPDRVCVDSTLEVLSPSSPCSHSSEASLFSIDSPPHLDSPIEDTEAYGETRSANDDEPTDADYVLDGVSNTIDNHTDEHTHDRSLLYKRERDGTKITQFAGRHSADLSELSDGDITRVANMVNIKTEERNKECDIVNNDDRRAFSSAIGAYIRLEMGTYSGRLARITSISKCRLRYSVIVLKYVGIRQLSKHTTIVAGTEIHLEEDSYTASDAILIEQDKEYLKMREGAITGIIQNKILRTEELRRIEIEKAAIKTNMLETAEEEQGEH